jgi:hypothetical protein
MLAISAASMLARRGDWRTKLAQAEPKAEE